MHCCIYLIAIQQLGRCRAHLKVHNRQLSAPDVQVRASLRSALSAPDELPMFIRPTSAPGSCAGVHQEDVKVPCH